VWCNDSTIGSHPVSGGLTPSIRSNFEKDNIMARYRKKSTTVEAVQLTWRTWCELCDFLGDIISPENPGRNTNNYSDTCGEQGGYIEITIPSTSGKTIVKHGEFIIKDDDQLYVCDPDIFRKTYEYIDEGYNDNDDI
jgi:hypothetical protein